MRSNVRGERTIEGGAGVLLGEERVGEVPVALHMGWQIGWSTQREHGILAGLPYLTGWVHLYAISGDMS